ncbi:uncharacterized protein VTP21DRAFT_315 [Calcarisporiella thermophila]|uniref:uncharacterized protein n=1 Tax=Calcarisporiella thermophila TaxID=911321 RepID=UPI0037420DEB
MTIQNKTFPSKNIDVARSRSLIRRTGSIGRRSLAQLQRSSSNAGGGEETHPVDVLTYRLLAWKVVIKNIKLFFKSQTSIHEFAMRASYRSGEQVDIPADIAKNFIPQGGIMELCSALKNSSVDIAQQHENISKKLNESLVELSQLKVELSEVKSYITRLQQDTSISNNNLDSLRERSKNKILELSKSVALVETSPEELNSKGDPFILNMAVRNFLEKEINVENNALRSLLDWQKKISLLDASIGERLFVIVQSWNTTFAPNNDSICKTILSASTTATRLLPKANEEWNSFALRHAKSLLDEKILLRSAQSIPYPNKQHFTVLPIIEGRLERKKTLSWGERYCVLTPAGYFHEFKSIDTSIYQEPSTSIFIPGCTIGTHPKGKKVEYSFFITEKKLGFLNLDQKYLYRTSSIEQMDEWCNKLQAFASLSIDNREFPRRYATSPIGQPIDSPASVAVASAAPKKEVCSHPAMTETQNNDQAEASSSQPQTAIASSSANTGKTSSNPSAETQNTTVSPVQQETTATSNSR